LAVQNRATGLSVTRLKNILMYTHDILTMAERVAMDEVVVLCGEIVVALPTISEKSTLRHVLVAVKNIKTRMTDIADNLLDTAHAETLRRSLLDLETLSLALLKHSSLGNMVEIACETLCEAMIHSPISVPASNDETIAAFMLNPTPEGLVFLSHIPGINKMASWKRVQAAMVCHVSELDGWIRTVWQDFVSDLSRISCYVPKLKQVESPVGKRVEVAMGIGVTGTHAVLECIEEDDHVHQDVELQPLLQVIKPLETALQIGSIESRETYKQDWQMDLQELVTLFHELSAIHLRLNKYKSDQKEKDGLFQTGRKIYACVSRLIQSIRPPLKKHRQLEPLLVNLQRVREGLDTQSLQLKMVTSVKGVMEDTDVDGDMIACVKNLVQGAINLKRCLESIAVIVAPSSSA
jgi:hypothetical protein